MAKAFLSKDTAERIRAARAGSTEKPAEKPVSANNASTPPTYTAPIPIPKPATITPSSSPAPSPPIQQVIIYPPIDNSALLKERGEKEQAQGLYQTEKLARAQSQERHKEEVERIKQAAKEQIEAVQREKEQTERLHKKELTRHEQLVKDDDSLKRRHNLVLEKVKTDEETIRRIAQENEALKQELEKLKKSNEEKTTIHETSEKDEDTKIESSVPLTPDYEEPHPAASITNIIPNNDVQLVGDIAADSPIEGGNDKCVIS
jgi:hypothetical protein